MVINMSSGNVGIGKTALCAPVGCSVLAYNYLDVDSIECAHGRAPAVATGIKRGRPDLIVFTYQGDGDLASIGMAEIVHAAARGENITVIFINNAIYGMTGGQVAPRSTPEEARLARAILIGLAVSTLFFTVLHHGFPQVLDVPSREGVPLSDFPTMLLLDLGVMAMAWLCFRHAGGGWGCWRRRRFWAGRSCSRGWRRACGF
jgi:hypothetical protein